MRRRAGWCPVRTKAVPSVLLIAALLAVPSTASLAGGFARPGPSHPSGVIPRSVTGMDSGAAAQPLSRTDRAAWAAPGTTGAPIGSFNRILRNVTLGNASYPVTPLYVAATGDVYVPVQGTANLSVISARTGLFLRNISVGTQPTTPCYVPTSGQLFVANFLGNDVTVLSVPSNTFVRTIPVFSEPITPMFDPLNDRVYIPNPDYVNGTGTITVVNATDDSIVARIWLPTIVGSDPSTPTLDPLNGNLFVSLTTSYYQQNWVVEINTTTNSVQNLLTVQSYPSPPVYDPMYHALYVANLENGFSGNATISVIAGNNGSLLAPLPIPAGSGEPALDPTTGDLLVPFSWPPAENITAISPATGRAVAVIPAGNGPGTPVPDPADGDAYVADHGGGNVTVFNLSTYRVVASINTGAVLGDPAIDPGAGLLFLPDGTSNVSEIYGGPFLANLSVSPRSTDIGHAITLTTTYLGGEGSLSVTYGGLPSGCGTPDQFVLTCSPGTAENTTVLATVTDALGASTRSSVNLSVNSAPQVTLQVAPVGSVDLGQTVHLLASIAGGTRPYRYNFTPLPAGCSAGDQPSLTCIPSAPGTTNVSVLIFDTYNLSALAWGNVSVAADPSVAGVVLTPSVPVAGEALTLRVDVRGGVAPFTFTYGALPPGCVSANRSTLTCVPSAPGAFALQLVVTDSTGWAVLFNETVHVAAPASPSPLLGTGSLGYLLIAGVVGAAVLAGAVVGLRRRHRNHRPPR